MMSGWGSLKHWRARRSYPDRQGSRNKLAEAFLADVYADWLEHGILALVRVREKQPAAYLRVVASLLPQHVEVSDDVGLLSDDELDARLKLVEAALGKSDGTQAGKARAAVREVATLSAER